MSIGELGREIGERCAVVHGFYREHRISRGMLMDEMAVLKSRCPTDIMREKIDFWPAGLLKRVKPRPNIQAKHRTMARARIRG